MIISFYSKAHATTKHENIESEWVSRKLETNDKNGGILVSEQQQSSGKMNGVAMSRTKARMQNGERKNENKKQEAWLGQRAQDSGHCPLTLPLEVYDGYQPINKCCKWT